MSNTFNFKRFCKYFMFDLKHQKDNIGMFVLFFMLFPIFFYCIYMIFGAMNTDISFLDVFKGAVEGPQSKFRFILFMLVSGVFMMIHPSKAYGEITDKGKGRAWLLVPASRTEKFLSMMLITLVVIPTIYIAGYMASDWLTCLIDKSCGLSLIGGGIQDIKDQAFGLQSDNANTLWFIVAAVLQTASVFLLGALIFKKWKVVGTFIAQFLICNVLMIIGAICISKFGEDFGTWFGTWFESHEYMADIVVNTVLNTVLAIVVIGCGTWSWFRLKRLQH